MLKNLRSTLASWLWRKSTYNERPLNVGTDHEEAYGVGCPAQAKTLPAVFAALDLYKRTLPTLPLVTYTRDGDNGRTRNRTHPASKVLHDRVNAGMSPITWLEILVDDYFMHGEHVAIIQWKGNNNINAIYPVPIGSVVKVERDEDWNKTYTIKTDDGVKVLGDSEVLHVMKDSPDGIRGTSIIDFAFSNLSLHRRIQESASTYYRNAAKPSVLVKGEFGKPEARAEAERAFNEKYAGVGNSGRVPFVSTNTSIEKFPNTTAEESQIIAALNNSTADVARWFGLSPLTLGDLTRGTYSNLAADNESFYQRSLRPLLVKIESELNAKIFGLDAPTYAEFMVDAVLRGSPAEQQAIFNGYIQSGVMTRAEVRVFLNLPPLEGLDTPLAPTNQAVVTGAADAQPLVEQPQQEQPVTEVAAA